MDAGINLMFSGTRTPRKAQLTAKGYIQALNVMVWGLRYKGLDLCGLLWLHDALELYRWPNVTLSKVHFYLSQKSPPRKIDCFLSILPPNSSRMLNWWCCTAFRRPWKLCISTKNIAWYQEFSGTCHKQRKSLQPWVFAFEISYNIVRFNKEPLFLFPGSFPDLQRGSLNFGGIGVILLAQVIWWSQRCRYLPKGLLLATMFISQVLVIGPRQLSHDLSN